jgi:hypothetical protein
LHIGGAKFLVFYGVASVSALPKLSVPFFPDRCFATLFGGIFGAERTGPAK